MAKYVCTADEARDFSKLGRVEPGQVVEADENPDGSFFMQAADNATPGAVLVGGFEVEPEWVDVTDKVVSFEVEPAKPKRGRKPKDGDV